MTLYEALPLLQGSLAGLLLVVVTWTGWKSTGNRLFAAFLLSLTIWGFLIFGMRSTPNLDRALHLERTATVLMASASTFFYYFAVSYSNAKLSSPRMFLAYIYLLVVLILSPTALIVEHMTIDQYGNAPVFGPLSLVFFMPLYLLVLMAIYHLNRARRSSTSYEERNRLLYFIIGALAVLIGGLMDVVSTFDIGIIPGGVIGNIVFATLTTVAILRYHLFDIQLVTHKVTPYLLMFTTFSLAYAATFFIMGHFWGNQPASIGAGLTIVAFAIAGGKRMWERAELLTNLFFYQERYRHIQSLNQLHEEAFSVSDASIITTLFPQRIKDAMQATHTSLLLSSSSGDLEPVTVVGSDSQVSRLVIKRESPIIKWFESHSEVLRRTDMPSIPELQALPTAEIATFENTDSELYFPLKFSGRLVGLLVIGPNIHRQPYSWEDERMVMRIAGHMALTIENIQLYQTSLKRERWLTALNEISRAVGQSLELDDVLNETMDKMLQMLNIEHGTMHIFDKESELLILKVCRGMNSETVQPITFVDAFAKGWMQQVARSGEQVFIESLPDSPLIQNPNLEWVAMEKFQSMVCLPLESRGEVKGVLCGYTHEGRVFTRDEVELITTIGHEISNAMESFDLIVETAEVKALREMDRLRSRLLSVVSHELRTPLTTIKGYASMLRDYGDRLSPDEKKQHMDSIDRSSDRLTNLIEQLLDMSRLESGTLKIQKAPTKISDLMHLIGKEAQIRISDHRIDLNLLEPLPLVNIDAKRIRQVVENLIDNAVKYSMPETKVTVSALQAGQELLISVADQGIGIAAKDLTKLFTPMYRVESHLSAKVGGIGLGLSICKGIVEAHGGRIWMESKEGKGSTCFFTLPLGVGDKGGDQTASKSVN